MNDIKFINGGVTAPKGFLASGVHAGIRKNKTKKDLAIIVSEVPANASAVYTTNLVKGAPIYVTQENLKNGKARAVICNSGYANTCAVGGKELALATCEIVEKHFGIPKTDIIVASTGIIGQLMTLEPFEKGVPLLKENLSIIEGGEDASEAIMTTDTFKKQVAVSFTVGGKTAVIGGIAKGSGMINPNMATMLAFLTTDIAISAKMLKKALSEDTQKTFNMVSVDGDTSTNDMYSIMANGMAGNKEITKDGEDFKAFCTALNAVSTALSKMLAKDGEGATKLIECTVEGAKSEKTARLCAKSVISSSLFKSAMFGADANWGRVLCALGYAGADINVNKISVSFSSLAGTAEVCENGMGLNFCETNAKKVLSEKEIFVKINLNSGDKSATAWGCDLTYDYVKINGDYRS
ncbi:MAG: bifunctional glutamate N-acetyltransferase/amino-acid acetyltransferase ArgJ [Firmicutes bacterium]|nr:bifunctional glutamate N-acetyltransferase/amino-acid acetyltransferase ArgJ [Bacillota bacterium]